MSPRVRRCRGCQSLLTAGRVCDACETATVHVITDLGPTDGPGQRIRARLLGPHVNGMRIFYYDPPAAC